MTADDERLIIADDARDLVRRHAAVVQQVATLLGGRLRGEPVRRVRIERGADDGDTGGDILVFRVSVQGEVEEAQHVWERIEQELGDLQRLLPLDQRRVLSEAIDVVLDWAP